MDNEYLKRIYGLLESGATLGTGAVSGLVGLPYGLYKGVTSGAYGTPEAPRIAAREAQQFMERNTYQPRTAEGQANLQQLAGLLEASKLPPVMPEASLLAAIPKQAYAAQAERAGMAAEKAIAPVVTRTMERGGLPAQLLGDLSQGSIRPMDVWHGSPHGPFEKFDPTKIGSGEGAQAFSYGHYLGEARGTGETYKEALSGSGKKLVNATFSDDPELWVAGQLYSKVSKPDIVEGLDILGYKGDVNKIIESAKKRMDSELSSGYLYKVDLPDEAIANMLDWDKPVSKQPNVMKALRSEAEQRVRANKLADIENDIRSSLPAQEIGDDYLSMFSDANVGKNQEIQSQALEKLNKMDLKPLIDKELDNMKPVDMNWNMTGKEFYELLSTREGSPEKASGLLQRQGVPGTRYLDAGSRTPGGSDTSNFVVFPGGEDLLTIKEINDKPIGGLLGQSKAAEATDLLSYRGSHTAPGPDFGAPLHDLTGGGQMYPADVYSPKAAQYYGGGVPYDQKAFDIAQSFKDKPNATVTIYRAVPKEMSNSEKLADIEKQMAAYMKRGTLPKDAENFSSGSKWYDWAYDQREALRNMPDEPAAKIGINSGDWVTLTKEYAKDHGESALNGQYKIISKKVKAKDVWTNADSIHEFGYHPSE